MSSDGRTRIPLPIAIGAVLGLAFLALPFAAVLIRTPWSSLTKLWRTADVLTALRLSVVTATTATAICIVLGVPLAWVLARSTLPGIRLVRALVLLPLILPPVVGGLALLYGFGRNGVFGRYLDEWFGITLPFSTAAVVVAETFVALPFLVVSVEGALRTSDLGLEEAAATLGASRLRIFRTITLPLIAPSLLAGAVLCWARAIGEFGATITFAGNFPGTTQTMPLAVYNALQSDPEAAIAISLVMVAVALAVLVALRDRWLRGGALG